MRKELNYNRLAFYTKSLTKNEPLTNMDQVKPSVPKQGIGGILEYSALLGGILAYSALLVKICFF